MSASMTMNSFSCSLTIPTSNCQESSSTPNTPEILNTILNISPDKNKLTSDQNKSEPIKVPNTPEILNSIVSLVSRGDTFPLESFTPCEYDQKEKVKKLEGTHHPEKKNTGEVEVQKNSETVKDVLKQRMKRKRSDVEQMPHCYSFDSSEMKIENEVPTWEDEIRRHRRRERNKVAATKCRNKKKERTTRLIAEGEVLEVQNVTLKEELERLVAQEKKLKDMLQYHGASCAKKMKKYEESDQTAPEEGKCESPLSNTDLDWIYSPAKCPGFEDIQYEGIKEAASTNIYGNTGCSNYGVFSQRSHPSPCKEKGEYLQNFSNMRNDLKSLQCRGNQNQNNIFYPDNFADHNNFYMESKITQFSGFPWQFDNECIAL